MHIDEFWQIVELGKDENEPELTLKTQLEKLGFEEVQSFQEHFDQVFDSAYKWDLWGAAYLIHGGCSDDGFTDFRYALISRGKEVFSKALISPDSLAELGSKVEELDNESYGYVAGEVYETKTGEDMPTMESTLTDGDLGEEWDFDDESELRKRLPKLFLRMQ